MNKLTPDTMGTLMCVVSKKKEPASSNPLARNRLTYTPHVRDERTAIACEAFIEDLVLGSCQMNSAKIENRLSKKTLKEYVEKNDVYDFLVDVVDAKYCGPTKRQPRPASQSMKKNDRKETSSKALGDSTHVSVPGKKKPPTKQTPRFEDTFEEEDLSFGDLGDI